MDDLTRQRLNRESQAFKKRMQERMPSELWNRSLYFDRRGEPIGLGDWAALHSQEGYVRVASTYVEDVWVSTVWIGHDMSLSFGPPVVFETMIFGGPLDQWQARYSDEAEALRGHLVAVALAESVPWWRKLWAIFVGSIEQAQSDYARNHLWPYRPPDAQPVPLWVVR